MNATLAEIAEATGGGLVQGDRASRVNGVTTDSRAVTPGQLFIALVGERFDGHRFVAGAFRAGAAAALVARWPEGLATDRPVIVAADTLRAYGDLAAWWRGTMPARVAGITGSNGKTTTKEMLAVILAGQGPTLCSEANHNNHVGVPETLLRLRRGHRFAVVEMGTNHFGELAPLAQFTRPHVGIITNVGPTHLEAFGSEEGVAREKATLLDAIVPGGLAVLHADDPWSRAVAERHEGRKVTFGLSRGADWRAAKIRQANGHLRFVVERTGDPVVLPAVGRWQASNALAALAAAAELGVSVADAAARLALFKPPKWRMDLRRVRRMTLLLDCYNANPASMLAAVEELARRPCRGRRVAVLGDMLELGSVSAAAHRRVGRAVAAAGIDLLCAVGEQAGLLADEARAGGMDEARVFHTCDREAAAGWLVGQVQPHDAVLFKASRGIQLELVANAVMAGAERPAGAQPAPLPAAAEVAAT